jgi:hypothetical protein
MRQGFGCFEAGRVVVRSSGYCAAFVFIFFVHDCFYYPFCLVLLGVVGPVKCCFSKLLLPTEIPLLLLTKNNTLHRCWPTSKNRKNDY